MLETVDMLLTDVRVLCNGTASLYFCKDSESVFQGMTLFSFSSLQALHPRTRTFQVSARISRLPDGIAYKRA
jgi:hypothetical protein